MKVFEKIVEQELPPLNPCVLWLNTALQPAALYHFYNGKWCAMTELNLSEVAKQGDNKYATLSDVCDSLETITREEVYDMWGMVPPVE